MATRFISPAQKHLQKDWNGRLTTENHLGAIWQHEPHLMSKMTTVLYKKDLGMDLLSFIEQFPVEYAPQNRPFEWLLQGRDRKNIPLLGAKDMSGSPVTATSKFGQYQGRFILTFPEDYFYADHIIVGMKPDIYHVRVVEEPIQNGSEYDYVCELWTNDPTLFIPYEELEANTLWSISHTYTEQTLSVRGTGVNHTSPFRMQNRFSMMRKEYTVPGNMIDEGKNSPLLWSFKDPNTGKTQETWIGKLDWDFMKQFRYEYASLLMYGKSNMLADGSYANKGASGNVIKSGLGLREQIAPSHINYYNELDLNAMTEFALSLSVGKESQDSRRMVVATGEYGLRAVSRAIEQLPSAQALAYGTTNRFSVGKDGKQGYERTQFVRYADINGIKFEFVLQPHYDDDVANKLKHPTKGGLAESHRMTFLDFGSQNGEANIKRVLPEGGQHEGMAYINGLRDPFNPNGTHQAPKNISSVVDGYSVHRWAYGAIKITNPLRTGEWIPNILK